MATSLLDWIVDLMRNDSARAAFNTNPQTEMAAAGFTEVCGADVADSRAFLFDNPAIREVAGVDVPQDDDADAPTQIRYIINNYTIEQPGDVTGPTTIVDDGPEDEDEQETTITGDGNTVSSNQENTTDQSDSSTDTDQEADNVVIGDHAVGEDQISGLENIGEGSSGEGNINILSLQDVVDIEESPFLNHVVDDSVNNLATNALQNATDLINVL